MSQVIKAAEQAARRAVRELDNQIAAVRRDAERKIQNLEGERERWRALADGHGPRRRPRRVDSEKIAGPAAIESVRTHLLEHGPTFQSALTMELGLNSGTVTHALRVLARKGEIVATGRKLRNSPEFAHVMAPNGPRAVEPEEQAVAS